MQYWEFNSDCAIVFCRIKASKKIVELEWTQSVDIIKASFGHTLLSIRSFYSRPWICSWFTLLTVPPFIGYWQIPGGALSPGATFRANARGCPGRGMVAARIDPCTRLEPVTIRLLAQHPSNWATRSSCALSFVFLGDYGVPKPWYFPFLKSYWYSRTSKRLNSPRSAGPNQSENSQPYRMLGEQVNLLNSYFALIQANSVVNFGRVENTANSIHLQTPRDQLLRSLFF